MANIVLLGFVFIVRTGVLASAIAIVINLPYSPSIRFLMLLGGLWAYWVIRTQLDLNKRLQRLEYWSRLTFVTEHLRNEREGIPSAGGRLKDDLEAEAFDTGRREEALGWVNLGLLGALLVGVGVLLHLGVFGAVGIGWLHSR